jgi:hypothetical protein
MSLPKFVNACPIAYAAAHLCVADSPLASSDLLRSIRENNEALGFHTSKVGGRYCATRWNSARRSYSLSSPPLF